MGPNKMLAFAGAATALLATTAVNAADFPAAPPPQMVRAPVAEATGWYLRGDIGVGNQQFKSFDHTQTAGGAWPASWRIDVKDIKDTFFFAAGIGYAWNNWLRFDVTGEYRADVKFKAVGSYTEFCAPGERCFDKYDGDHSAAVFLANAYIDLGTWWCLTPFIGAGVGAAYHMTAGLTDTGHGTSVGGDPISVLGYADKNHANWSFAWAAHAGVAYTVTNSFKVELGYRYLNMGSAQTAEIQCGATGCGAGGGPRAHYHLRTLDSHDLKFGMRWMLQPEPVYQPPLMRRG
jgi:opacity protein-like surface antigen